MRFLGRNALPYQLSPPGALVPLSGVHGYSAFTENLPAVPLPIAVPTPIEVDLTIPLEHVRDVTHGSVFPIDFGQGIRLFGYAMFPADNDTYSGTLTFDAPDNMIEGQLCIMYGTKRAATALSGAAVTQAGGQKWRPVGELAHTSGGLKAWACIFNGTWTADPAIDMDSGAATSGGLFVFSNSTGKRWILEQVRLVGQAAGDFSITPPDFRGSSGISFVAVYVQDDVQLSAPSGTGWIQAGPQFLRNLAGSDSSIAQAYKVLSASGAIDTLSITQGTNGPDSGLSFQINWREEAPIESASDDFNRADGALGSNWLRTTTAGGVVASNRMAAGSSGVNGSIWVGGAMPSDQATQVEYISGTSLWNMYVRFQGEGAESEERTGYILAITSTTTWAIRISTLGVDTDLLTGSFPSALTSGDVLQFRAAGSSLSVSLNGSLLGSVTDTTYTGGQPGIAVNQTATAVVLDNWLAATAIDADATLPAEWRAGINADAIVPLEYLQAIAAGSEIPVEWLATEEEVDTVDSDHALLIEWLASLNIDAALNAEFLQGINSSAAAPAEWLGALNADAAVPVEHLQGLNANSQIILEWLLEILHADVFPVEYLQGIQGANEILGEWSLQLAAPAALPVEYLSGIAHSSAAPVEWLAGIHANNAVLGEWSSQFAADQPIPLEHLQAIVSGAAMLLEAGAGIAHASAVPLEFLQGINSDAPLLAEWFAPIESGSTIPAEWTTGIAGTHAVPFEHLQGIHAGSEIPAEWGGAIAIVSDAPLPIEWTSQILRDAAVPAEWLAQLASNSAVLIDSLGGLRGDIAVPLEHLQGIAGAAAAPLEWSSQITVSSAIALEWVSALSASIAIPLEWTQLATVQADSPLPVEWRLGVRAEHGIPVDWWGSLGVVAEHEGDCLTWRAEPWNGVWEADPELGESDSQWRAEPWAGAWAAEHGGEAWETECAGSC